jgi:hypothetical protein
MAGPHDAVTRVVALRQTRGGWSTKLPPLPRLPRGDHPNYLTDYLTALSCGAPGSCLGVGTWINDRGDGTGGGMSLAFSLVAGNRSIRRHTPVVPAWSPTAAPTTASSG